MLICSDAGNGLVTVDMGAPKLGLGRDSAGQAADTNEFATARWTAAHISAGAVSMGNPHCVLFVDDAEAAPVTQPGPAASKPIPCFPTASMSNSPRCSTAAISACGCGNAAWA